MLRTKQDEGCVWYSCENLRGDPVKRDFPERGGHRHEGLKLSYIINCFVSTLSCRSVSELNINGLFDTASGSRHIIRESLVILTCRSSHIWKMGLILPRLAE